MDDMLVDYINGKQYSQLQHLTPGHAGCRVVLVKTRLGEERIIKYANSKSGKIEIRNNIRGYEGIQNIGAFKILPDGYSFTSQHNLDLLELPYLGQNITNTLNDGIQLVWEDFWRIVTITIKPTIKAAPKSSKLLFADYFDVLHTTLNTINSNEYKTANKFLLNEAINKLSSTRQKQSLMLLDFTPDNTFFDGKSVKYIDPWSQKSYKGSFLPSIGQFVKLAKDIYKLPSTQCSNFINSYNSAINDLAEDMGLKKEEAEIQIKLGEILQLALSSIVRIEKDPEKAVSYYNECITTLKGIME